MSYLTPAILRTEGAHAGSVEYRIALAYDFPSDPLTHDKTTQTWYVAGTFDASAVHSTLEAARDAIGTLRDQRAKEVGKESFTLEPGKYRFVDLKHVPFAGIKHDGMAWAERIRAVNLKKGRRLRHA